MLDEQRALHKADDSDPTSFDKRGALRKRRTALVRNAIPHKLFVACLQRDAGRRAVLLVQHDVDDLEKSRVGGLAYAVGPALQVARIDADVGAQLVEPAEQLRSALDAQAVERVGAHCWSSAVRVLQPIIPYVGRRPTLKAP